MGIVFGLLSAISWGSADFFAAKLTRLFGNIVTLFWMLGTGLLVSIVYLLFAISSFDLSNVARYLPLLALIGLLQFIALLSFYKALSVGKVGIVTPISASWPLVTVIFSVVVLGEHLLANQMLGIVLILIGTIFLSANITDIRLDKKSMLLRGVQPAVVSMTAFGVAFFLVTPVSRDLGWFLPTFFYRLFTFLWLLLYIITQKNVHLLPKNQSVLPLLPVGILDMSAFFMYGIGITIAPTAIVAPLIAVTPLVSTMLAYIVLKEKLSTLQVAGSISVVVGVIAISV